MNEIEMLECKSPSPIELIHVPFLKRRELNDVQLLFNFLIF